MQRLFLCTGQRGFGVVHKNPIILPGGSCLLWYPWPSEPAYGLFSIRYYVFMGGEIKPIETLYRGYRFRSRLEARWAVFFDAARIPWRYEEEGFDLSGVVLPNEPGAFDQYLDSDDTTTIPTDAPLWYLPDFYLPRQECWVEVKARKPSYRERVMMARLVWGSGKNGYIAWDLRPPREVQRSSLPADTSFNSAMGFRVVQDPREPYKDEDRIVWALQCFALGIDFEDEAPGPVVEVEFDHQWCECPRCGLLGITSYGNARLLACGCLVEPATRARLSYTDPDPVYNDDSSRLMGAYIAARQARFERRERAQVYILQDKLDRIQKVLESDDTE